MDDSRVEEAGRVAADGGSSAVAEVLERVRGRGVRFAELWFSELSGRPRRVAIVAEQVHEALFSAGVVLDGPSTGRDAEGVFRLVPDPAAAYLDPVASITTLAVLGEVDDPTDPRQALGRAEVYLRDSGVAARCVMGAEPELFLLEADGTAAQEETVWAHLREMASALAETGIQIDGFRTGPAAGQGRVQMRASEPRRLADQVVLYRYVARAVAGRSGRRVSFLSRPLPGPGSGSMPVHHALWKDGVNLFHEEGSWARTSPLCRWYAGGLLRHAPALMALCAPSTNSYRRMVPGTEAPTDLILSLHGRAAACRIPARSRAPAARRIKFRPPDASANPYLAFAAMLMAGLDGIENEIEPPRDDGPARLSPLPTCLEDALRALERDADFLKRGGVFSDDLLGAWIDDRWRRQILPVRSRPHPEELRLEEPG